MGFDEQHQRDQAELEALVDQAAPPPEILQRRPGPARIPTGDVLGPPAQRRRAPAEESTVGASILQGIGTLVFLGSWLSACAVKEKDLGSALGVIVGLIIGGTLMILGTVVKQGVLTRRQL
jgi:hypothetical protein